MLAKTLDFAVLSYARAHIGSVDETYLGARINSFEISSPILVSNQKRAPRSTRVIRMRRRSLHCLDQFLHREFWVFHLELQDDQDQMNGRLLLATQMATFADIWGTLWKCTRSSKADEIY